MEHFRSNHRTQVSTFKITPTTNLSSGLLSLPTMSDGTSRTRKALNSMTRPPCFPFFYCGLVPLRPLINGHYQPMPEQIRNRGEDRKSLRFVLAEFSCLVLGFERREARNALLLRGIHSRLIAGIDYLNLPPEKPDHGTVNGHGIDMAAQRREDTRTLASRRRRRHRQRRSPPSSSDICSVIPRARHIGILCPVFSLPTLGS